MINPAWAAYVIKEHDVIGKTAEITYDFEIIEES